MDKKTPKEPMENLVDQEPSQNHEEDQMEKLLQRQADRNVLRPSSARLKPAALTSLNMLHSI